MKKTTTQHKALYLSLSIVAVVAVSIIGAFITQQGTETRLVVKNSPQMKCTMQQGTYVKANLSNDFRPGQNGTILVEIFNPNGTYTSCSNISVNLIGPNLAQSVPCNPQWGTGICTLGGPFEPGHYHLTIDFDNNGSIEIYGGLYLSDVKNVMITSYSDPAKTMTWDWDDPYENSGVLYNLIYGPNIPWQHSCHDIFGTSYTVTVGTAPCSFYASNSYDYMIEAIDTGSISGPSWFDPSKSLFVSVTNSIGTAIPPLPVNP